MWENVVMRIGDNGWKYDMTCGSGEVLVDLSGPSPGRTWEGEDRTTEIGVHVNDLHQSHLNIPFF